MKYFPLTLSIDKKKLLLNYIKNNLNEKTITSRDNLENPFYVIKYDHCSHPIFRNLMIDWVKNNYEYTQEEFDSSMEMENCYESSFFKKIDDRNKNIKGYVECFLQFIDMIDIDKFSFTYNSTDYEPCNNICIRVSFKGGLYKDKRYFSLQIRKNDFPFNEGDCYGRNTQCMKTYRLDNSNFDKWCKNLNLKL